MLNLKQLEAAAKCNLFTKVIDFPCRSCSCCYVGRDKAVKDCIIETARTALELIADNKSLRAKESNYLETIETLVNEREQIKAELSSWQRGRGGIKV